MKSTNEQYADKLVPLAKSLTAKSEDEEKVIKCLYEIAEAISTGIGKYQAISKSSTNVIDRCEIIQSDIKNHKSNVITITKTVEVRIIAQFNNAHYTYQHTRYAKSI